MALLMGILTMIRITRHVPRKLTEAAFCVCSEHCEITTMKAPGIISFNDHMALIKRVAELEEKVSLLNIKPSMPKEKEELLNATLGRVRSLEQELAASKKVLLLTSLFPFILERHPYLRTKM